MKRTALAKRSSKSSVILTKSPAKRRRAQTRFVLCVADSEPDLQMGKIYRVLPDAAAAEDGYLRVVDDSGEDYLYSERFFSSVELPKEAQDILAVDTQSR
jgi:hypothetical protein